MAEVQYSEVLLSWLLEKAERSIECTNEANKDNKRRVALVVKNEMRYQVRRSCDLVKLHGDQLGISGCQVKDYGA